MKEMNKDIAEYFNLFDDETRSRLSLIRELAFRLLPDADEGIKYRMPTIIHNGNVFHYAAFKNHIGIYPLPRVLELMKDELAGYVRGKGSIQFQNSEPLPLGLIEKIIKARIEEKVESDT